MNTYYCDVAVICVPPNTDPKSNANTYHCVFPYLGNVSLVIRVLLLGKHISLVICVPLPGKHIPLVICVPLPGKHISVPLPGKDITSDMCSPIQGTHPE